MKAPRFATRRMMIGSRESVDTICIPCLAIVPRPEEGCSHCQRKAAKAQEGLAAFKAKIAAEGGAL